MGKRVSKKPAAPQVEPELPVPPLRPLRLEWLDPGELSPNPHNFRTHPEGQLRAVEDLIGEVGWAGALLYNERTKRLIDGHARKELFAGKGAVPVLVGDWDETTEAKILATLDPVGAQAGTDQAKLVEVLALVSTESEAVKGLLADLQGKPAEVEAAKKGAGEEDVLLEKHFSVLVRCESEDEQRAVLGEMVRHELDARALIVDYPTAEKIEATAGPELKAGEIEIVRSVKIKRTPRVMQLEGLFDVPPSKQAEQRWRCRLELDRPWNIGLIVGASGSGKTTLAREIFGAQIVEGWTWSEDRALIEDFPAGMSVAEITAILGSVGFSSPPDWLKPFRVLSNGQQFRVNLARTLAEQPELAVVDEFTSVVDRTVAQIGSAALSKAVRARGNKVIAVTCHFDVEEWLQPDWVVQMPGGALAWRSVRRRPEIQLRVSRTKPTAWEVFRGHHYLSHDLHPGAQCFLGTIEGRPAAFTAVLHYPHWAGGWWREHRTVCHPDFQGVGVGNAMSELIASAFVATGKAYRSTTSHPAMIRHRLKSPLWRCTRPPGMATSTPKSRHKVSASRAAFRYTAGFEYLGPVMPLEEVRRLGVRLG